MSRMAAELPGSSDAILEQIAKETLITKVEVLRRLLAVLDIVHAQKSEGHHLTLVDIDGKFVSRLIGM